MSVNAIIENYRTNPRRHLSRCLSLLFTAMVSGVSTYRTSGSWKGEPVVADLVYIWLVSSKDGLELLPSVPFVCEGSLRRAPCKSFTAFLLMRRRPSGSSWPILHRLDPLSQPGSIGCRNSWLLQKKTEFHYKRRQFSSAGLWLEDRFRQPLDRLFERADFYLER